MLARRSFFSLSLALSVAATASAQSMRNVACLIEDESQPANDIASNTAPAGTADQLPGAQCAPAGIQPVGYYGAPSGCACGPTCGSECYSYGCNAGPSCNCGGGSYGSCNCGGGNYGDCNYGGCNPCGDGNACCNGAGGDDYWCNTISGPTFEAQVLFLRAHQTEATNTGDSFETASRFTIGCLNDRGREWRLRYFEYATATNNGTSYLETEYTDVEYAGRFTLGCNWQGELSGGVRWAQFDESNDWNYSNTFGPELGLLVRGPQFCNCQMFGNIRNSWQFGSPFGESYGTFSITEVQLGVQHDCYVRGFDGFIRGLFEVQKWDGASDQDSEDIGLIGVGFAAGFTR